VIEFTPRCQLAWLADLRTDLCRETAPRLALILISPGAADLYRVPERRANRRHLIAATGRFRRLQREAGSRSTSPPHWHPGKRWWRAPKRPEMVFEVVERATDCPNWHVPPSMIRVGAFRLCRPVASQQTRRVQGIVGDPSAPRLPRQEPDASSVRQRRIVTGSPSRRTGAPGRVVLDEHAGIEDILVTRPVRVPCSIWKKVAPGIRSAWSRTDAICFRRSGSRSLPPDGRRHRESSLARSLSTPGWRSSSGRSRSAGKQMASVRDQAERISRCRLPSRSTGDPHRRCEPGYPRYQHVHRGRHGPGRLFRREGEPVTNLL